ncbi:hypothetical protein PENTCL1PPCAC_25472, partial [Pristionchus entomophagus]
RMRAVLIIALIAAVALAKRELTDEERVKYDEIRQAKLEKLSPEAQTAGKKIHEIFQAKKEDRKAAHEEVHAFIGTLPESVRAELKSIRRGAHSERKPLTEEQKAGFQARLQEKLDKLSDEGKAAAKKIHEIRQANKGDRKAAKEAIDKVLEGLSESVRDELKALRPTHHRGQRTSTPKA